MLIPQDDPTDSGRPRLHLGMVTTSGVVICQPSRQRVGRPSSRSRRAPAPAIRALGPSPGEAAGSGSRQEPEAESARNERETPFVSARLRHFEQTVGMTTVDLAAAVARDTQLPEAGVRAVLRLLDKGPPCR